MLKLTLSICITGCDNAIANQGINNTNTIFEN